MAANGAAPMDITNEDLISQQRAEKFIRLQQLISTGDITAIRLVLQEAPQLENDDINTLWFDIFRHHHSAETALMLQLFIEHGANPEQVDDDSMSALHLACSHCLKDCVSLLLDLSPHVLNEADVFGMLPLHHAISMCKTQHALEGDELRNSSDSAGLRSSSDFSITLNDLPDAESIVALLIDRGAYVNLQDSISSSKPPSYTTPLCFAVDIGNVRVVEMLLKAGAIVNPALGRGDGSCPRKCPPLQCALDNSDIPLAELLVQHGARCDVKLSDNSYLLHHYCTQGNLQAVQFLLNHKVQIDSPGGNRKETPLQIAASHGYTNVMEELLSRGARIPTKVSSPLLTTTAFSGSVSAVQLLLDYGVPVNTQGTFGITALFIACSKSASMVELLLKSGADPNLGGVHHKPVFNILPLHRRTANTEAAGIVKALIKHNADINLKNNDHFYKKGQVSISLFHRALLCGEADVVELLLKSGASVQGTTTDMLQCFKQKCSSNKRTMNMLHYHITNPYSLSQLCRSEIRRHFHPCQISNIQSLPLPLQIKEYLCFYEL